MLSTPFPHVDDTRLMRDIHPTSSNRDLASTTPSSTAVQPADITIPPPAAATVPAVISPAAESASVASGVGANADARDDLEALRMEARGLLGIPATTAAAPGDTREAVTSDAPSDTLGQVGQGAREGGRSSDPLEGFELLGYEAGVPSAGVAQEGVVGADRGMIEGMQGGMGMGDRDLSEPGSTSNRMRSDTAAGFDDTAAGFGGSGRAGGVDETHQPGSTSATIPSDTAAGPGVAVDDVVPSTPFEGAQPTSAAAGEAYGADREIVDVAHQPSGAPSAYESVVEGHLLEDLSEQEEEGEGAAAEAAITAAAAAGGASSRPPGFAFRMVGGLFSAVGTLIGYAAGTAAGLSDQQSGDLEGQAGRVGSGPEGRRVGSAGAVRSMSRIVSGGEEEIHRIMTGAAGAGGEEEGDGAGRTISRKPAAGVDENMDVLNPELVEQEGVGEQLEGVPSAAFWTAAPGVALGIEKEAYEGGRPETVDTAALPSGAVEEGGRGVVGGSVVSKVPAALGLAGEAAAHTVGYVAGAAAATAATAADKAAAAAEGAAKAAGYVAGKTAAVAGTAGEGLATGAATARDATAAAAESTVKTAGYVAGKTAAVAGTAGEGLATGAATARDASAAAAESAAKTAGYVAGRVAPAAATAREGVSSTTAVAADRGAGAAASTKEVVVEKIPAAAVAAGEAVAKAAGYVAGSAAAMVGGGVGQGAGAVGQEQASVTSGVSPVARFSEESVVTPRALDSELVELEGVVEEGIREAGGEGLQEGDEEEGRRERQLAKRLRAEAGYNRGVQTPGGTVQQLPNTKSSGGGGLGMVGLSRDGGGEGRRGVMEGGTGVGGGPYEQQQGLGISGGVAAALGGQRARLSDIAARYNRLMRGEVPEARPATTAPAVAAAGRRSPAAAGGGDVRYTAASRQLAQQLGGEGIEGGYGRGREEERGEGGSGVPGVASRMPATLSSAAAATREGVAQTAVVTRDRATAAAASARDVSARTTGYVADTAATTAAAAKERAVAAAEAARANAVAATTRAADVTASTAGYLAESAAVARERAAAAAGAARKTATAATTRAADATASTAGYLAGTATATAAAARERAAAAAGAARKTATAATTRAADATAGTAGYLADTAAAARESATAATTRAADTGARAVGYVAGRAGPVAAAAQDTAARTAGYVVDSTTAAAEEAARRAGYVAGIAAPYAASAQEAAARASEVATARAAAAASNLSGVEAAEEVQARGLMPSVAAATGAAAGAAVGVVGGTLAAVGGIISAVLPEGGAAAAEGQGGRGVTRAGDTGDHLSGRGYGRSASGEDRPHRDWWVGEEGGVGMEGAEFRRGEGDTGVLSRRRSLSDAATRYNSGLLSPQRPWALETEGRPERVPREAEGGTRITRGRDTGAASDIPPPAIVTLAPAGPEGGVTEGPLHKLLDQPEKHTQVQNKLAELAVRYNAAVSPALDAASAVVGTLAGVAAVGYGVAATATEMAGGAVVGTAEYVADKAQYAPAAAETVAGTLGYVAGRVAAVPEKVGEVRDRAVQAVGEAREKTVQAVGDVGERTAYAVGYAAGRVPAGVESAGDAAAHGAGYAVGRAPGVVATAAGAAAEGVKGVASKAAAAVAGATESGPAAVEVPAAGGGGGGVMGGEAGGVSALREVAEKVKQSTEGDKLGLAEEGRGGATGVTPVPTVATGSGAGASSGGMRGVAGGRDGRRSSSPSPKSSPKSRGAAAAAAAAVPQDQLEQQLWEGNLDEVDRVPPPPAAEVEGGGSFSSRKGSRSQLPPLDTLPEGSAEEEDFEEGRSGRGPSGALMQSLGEEVDDQGSGFGVNVAAMPQAIVQVPSSSNVSEQPQQQQQEEMNDQEVLHCGVGAGFEGGVWGGGEGQQQLQDEVVHEPEVVVLPETAAVQEEALAGGVALHPYAESYVVEPTEEEVAAIDRGAAATASGGLAALAPAPSGGAGRSGVGTGVGSGAPDVEVVQAIDITPLLGPTLAAAASTPAATAFTSAAGDGSFGVGPADLGGVGGGAGRVPGFTAPAGAAGIQGLEAVHGVDMEGGGVPKPIPAAEEFPNISAPAVPGIGGLGFGVEGVGDVVETEAGPELRAAGDEGTISGFGIGSGAAAEVEGLDLAADLTAPAPTVPTASGGKGGPGDLAGWGVGEGLPAIGAAALPPVTAAAVGGGGGGGGGRGGAVQMIRREVARAASADITDVTAGPAYDASATASDTAVPISRSSSSISSSSSSEESEGGVPEMYRQSSSSQGGMFSSLVQRYNSGLLQPAARFAAAVPAAAVAAPIAAAGAVAAVPVIAAGAVLAAPVAAAGVGLAAGSVAMKGVSTAVTAAEKGVEVVGEVAATGVHAADAVAGGALAAAGTAGSTAVQAAGTVASGAAATAGTVGMTALNTAATLAGGAASAAGVTGGAAIDVAETVLGGMASVAGTVGSTAVNAAGTVAGGTAAAAGAAGGSALNAYETAVGGGVRAAGTVGSTALQTAETVAGGTVSAAGAAGSGAVNAAETVVGGVASTAGTVASAGLNVAATVAGEALSAAGAAADTALGAAGTVASTGLNIASTVAGGAVSAAGTVAATGLNVAETATIVGLKAAGALASGVASAADAALDAAGTIASTGINAAGTVAGGAASATGAALGAAGTVAGAAVNAGETVGTVGLNAAGTLASGATSAGAVGATALDAAGTAAGAAASTAGTAAGAAGSAAVNAAGAVASGVGSAASGMASLATNTAGTMVEGAGGWGGSAVAGRVGSAASQVEDVGAAAAAATTAADADEHSLKRQRVIGKVGVPGGMGLEGVGIAASPPAAAAGGIGGIGGRESGMVIGAPVSGIGAVGKVQQLVMEEGAADTTQRSSRKGLEDRLSAGGEEVLGFSGRPVASSPAPGFAMGYSEPPALAASGSPAPSSATTTTQQQQQEIQRDQVHQAVEELRREKEEEERKMQELRKMSGQQVAAEVERSRAPAGAEGAEKRNGVMSASDELPCAPAAAAVGGGGGEGVEGEASGEWRGRGGGASDQGVKGGVGPLRSRGSGEIEVVPQSLRQAQQEQEGLRDVLLRVRGEVLPTLFWLPQFEGHRQLLMQILGPDWSFTDQIWSLIDWVLLPPKLVFNLWWGVTRGLLSLPYALVVLVKVTAVTVRILAEVAEAVWHRSAAAPEGGAAAAAAGEGAAVGRWGSVPSGSSSGEEYFLQRMVSWGFRGPPTTPYPSMEMGSGNLEEVEEGRQDMGR